MRRSEEEAVARAEYLWQRFGGDPETVFALEERELHPTSVALNAWLRAIQFLRLGENRLAQAELKLAVSVDQDQLQLMISAADE